VLTRCNSLFGRELMPGAHQIGPSHRATTQGGYSRSYLFEDDDDGGALTLVDTGWDTEARPILRYLDDIGRSPTKIKHIAFTHSHRSHLGGLALLAGISGAEVWAHKDEVLIIEGKKRAYPIQLWPPVPPVLVPFRIISWLPIFKHRTWKVNHHLKEGTEVGPLTTLWTPGHTPGHVAFHYRKSLLVVGDAVATWPRFGAGWPGFNRDEKEYRKSLLRLVRCSPDIVCPGHGDAITEDTAERLRTLVRGHKFSKLGATA
jgi:glyoxylase-like metal-dependent hydrolase (beta-lactamase superfamily II)